MRVLALAQPKDVEELCRKFLDRLVWLLGEVIKNPMNPFFNHFYFESMALMVKASAGFPETFQQLEAKLIPLMFTILQAEQSDLFPYAFQLLALFVEASPNRAVLPDYVKSLLPVIAQPVLWSISGNIPALTRFLQACIAKSPESFADFQFIESLLSIFRVLVNSKINDVYGFALISALFNVLPAGTVSRYLRPTFMLILSRVQTHKSQKLNSYILLFICGFITESQVPDPAQFLLQTLEQIQPRIYIMLFRSLFLSVIGKIQDSLDKKAVVVGCTEILKLLESMSTSTADDSQFW